eukprot:CAMPEP_0185252946 /NCGR_PEP_ID=MMETSP1359-20130426/1877_1 /TAXON_ID=552665 /ORGANISM="Bigelowiella longifila, Strain CCMP242" /LENGTH=107 /DNA_ID=CAMNT_0027835227 /DNA_START=638 /DNA_END=961 /DNA_ORIENTATION=+
MPISQMIERFVSEMIVAKNVQKLAAKFAETHLQYDMKKAHFDGFAMALVETIKSRLDCYGTITLIQVWKEIITDVTTRMFKAYSISKKKREKALQQVDQFMRQHQKV